MNLILLQNGDFVAEDRVRLEGRRLAHVRAVHGAVAGDELRVGVLNGRVGRGVVERIDREVLEMTVRLESDSPPKLPLRLILALPRPKVLNRVIAGAVSLGIAEIDLINAWRVEKAYWDSPRLAEENLREQAILGLEQSCDTVLPEIRLHRFFTPFVRDELASEIGVRLALVAHPLGGEDLPRQVNAPAVLAIGPEGGWSEREVETFEEIGFTRVGFGPRILRVETAVPFAVGRLF